MYRIVSGSTRGLADTEAFLALLDRPPEWLGREMEVANFFDAGREVVVSRAPGRLDLMGGIADYSGSLVLELPIADATHVAVQRQAGRTLMMVSLPTAPGGQVRHLGMPLSAFENVHGPVDYDDARSWFARVPQHHWAAYVAGAFVVLTRERGHVFEDGARILIRSSVPEGKGVSSSASLEVAVMQAVAAAYGIDLSPRDLAFLCQRVENFVAGAPCGVMDQMTAACGEADRLLALLCQPGELRGTVELPAELAVWGIDSGIRHSVGGAEYGTVRAAAFIGYRIIADLAGLPVRDAGVEGRVEIDDPMWGGYLANIDPQEFEGSFAPHLPERLSGAEFLARYRGITDRATTVVPDREYPVLEATRHPVRERDRVEAFAEILKGWTGSEKADELGALMYGSHASYSACGLGSDGTDELVALVRAARDRGLFGAKITGGGSGGTVAVLGRRGADEAIEHVASEYARRTGNEPFVISGSSPGAGAFGTVRLVMEESSWPHS